MRSFDPKKMTMPEMYAVMQSGISPRPIALVSTLSKDGVLNLSPFSFFNCFGLNPPMVAFGPGRRARDGTLKDTYYNLTATHECVIQAVTHAMVEQVNLASAEYPSSVDEFIKSGLTPIASTIVKPPRVKESPFQMECVLKNMIALGDEKGSGNLALCEVVAIHVADDVWTDDKINPHALDLVARMGYDFYCRASGESVFDLPKPSKIGMGFDGLPAAMKLSHVFTANNLARFAMSEKMPDAAEVSAFLAELEPMPEASESLLLRFQRRQDYRSMLRTALALKKAAHPKAQTLIEKSAKCAVENNDLDFAWKAALAAAR